MKKVEITKQDLKDNLFNIFLTIFYTAMIAIIYSWWAFIESSKIWLSCSIVIVVLLGGYLTGFLWIRGNVIKKNEQKEEPIK